MTTAWVFAQQQLALETDNMFAATVEQVMSKMPDTGSGKPVDVEEAADSILWHLYTTDQLAEPVRAQLQRFYDVPTVEQLVKSGEVSLGWHDINTKQYYPYPTDMLNDKDLREICDHWESLTWPSDRVTLKDKTLLLIETLQSALADPSSDVQDVCDSWTDKSWCEWADDNYEHLAAFEEFMVYDEEWEQLPMDLFEHLQLTS